MRTKISFIAAAALAAGLASSMAQSSNVYSANIVGYSTGSIPAKAKVFWSNPLDNGTNDLYSLFAAAPDKTIVNAWNGSSFDAYQFLSGVWKLNSVAADTIIGRGTAFFITAPQTKGVTNVFIGQAPVTNSLSLPGSSLKVAIGSPIPFSGTLTDSGPNTINFRGMPDKSIVNIWNGSSFDAYQYLSGVWKLNSVVANTTVGVGQGFFFSVNKAGVWNQQIQ